jgi:hypothetical protein
LRYWVGTDDIEPIDVKLTLDDGRTLLKLKMLRLKPVIAKLANDDNVGMLKLVKLVN